MVWHCPDESLIDMAYSCLPSCASAISKKRPAGRHALASSWVPELTWIMKQRYSSQKHKGKGSSRWWLLQTSEFGPDLLCRLYSGNGYLMQSSRLTLHIISIPLFLFFHFKKNIIYCEKGATEDEMVGWHNHLNGHEFEQTPGNREQRSLACCSPWGHKELDMTERLNENNLLFI